MITLLLLGVLPIQYPLCAPSWLDVEALESHLSKDPSIASIDSP